MATIGHYQDYTCGLLTL